LLDFGADLVLFNLAIKLSILECKLQESNQIQPKQIAAIFVCFAYYSIIILCSDFVCAKLFPLLFHGG
jgi:hypothetical protein